MKLKKPEPPLPKCLCCHHIFVPDPRVKNQKYCGSPACAKASKRAAQKAWRSRRRNRKKCAVHQKRWRCRNPDYMAKYRAGHPEYVRRENALRKVRHLNARHWQARAKNAVKRDMMPPSENPMFTGRLRAVIRDMIKTGVDERLAGFRFAVRAVKRDTIAYRGLPGV